MKILQFLSILILLFTFSLVGCEKKSSEWIKYKTDSDGNISYYKKVNIDKSSSKYIVQTWKKQVYSEKGREKEIQSRKEKGLPIEGWNKLNNCKSMIEVDCKKRMTNVALVSCFNIDDEELESINWDAKWEHITPDSQGEYVLNEVCKKSILPF